MLFPVTSDVFNRGIRLNLATGRKLSQNDRVGGLLWRCNTRQNLTGASPSQIRRGLTRAWRLILSSQIDEALTAIDQIERQLDDMSPAVAERFWTATQLLRAAGLAFQDDSLAALTIAASHLKESGPNQDCHPASTLCRLGLWQLGKFDDFFSLPRHHPGVQWSKSRAISAILDLSIEAAVAVDHLHMSTAKRLASDALEIAETALNAADGLSALPACLTAQVLYEEGSLDEAEIILRDRLPAINAEGFIECALRAYVVLTRIAKQRMQYDFATLLLREAEVLGERRRWPRLVAACLAERSSLFLQGGRMREARQSFEYLERYVETHRAGSGHSRSEIARYCTLTRWRVSWAETPSEEAVAALRQLYHHSVEKRDFYLGCQLAVELSEMLADIGESEEADALFLQTIKAGAAAGLYQIFLEGGASLGVLLTRAYDQVETPASTDRELRPFVGSLLSRWNARHAGIRSEQSSRRLSDTLTVRERYILTMISQGLTNKLIARTLQISPETVKSHVKRIFLKLAVGTRAEAVSLAKSLGLF
jgi:ATP/maltotriose-dependent transcriptional regulator MalT